jgi:hypothetical protein
MPIKLCIANQSSVLSDDQLVPVVEALQVQVSRDFAPNWGIDAILSLAHTGQAPDPDAWLLRVVDDPDVLGALGDHLVTDAGKPLGNVFAKIDIDEGSSWSVTISHEITEMLGDPFIISTVIGPDGNPWALEVADMVEADGLGYKVNDVLLSDFVLPGGFGATGVKLDFCNKMGSPFQIMPGGYIGVFKDGNWTQVQADRTPGGKAAPRGSRRYRRMLRAQN